MLRALLVNLLLVAVAVTAGVGGCRLTGRPPHGIEAAMAAGVAVAASVAAGGVLALAGLQPQTPTGQAQTALLAMVAHLGLTFALSAALLLLTPGVAMVPFACWDLGLFWVTLLGMAVVCVRVVRAPLPPMTPTTTN